jgi:hypothetical protein
VAVVRVEASMAENQDRARGPAGPDPQPGGVPPAAAYGGSEPAGPLGVPQRGGAGQGTGPARGRRSRLIVWAAVAVGAAAAVAVGVWVGLAQHAAPFNVVLFLLVVAVGGAEPVIRRRGGAPAGPAGARAAGPAAPAVKPAVRITSLVGICAVGGITGIYSLFAANGRRPAGFALACRLGTGGRTTTGVLRPLLPGHALTEGCDQLCARRDARHP